MGAAVDEAAQHAALVAHQHDRRRADVAGRVIAGLREFDFETEIVPVRAAKEPLVLKRVDFRIAEQFERHAAPAFDRPNQTARVAAAVDPPGIVCRRRHRTVPLCFWGLTLRPHCLRRGLQTPAFSAPHRGGGPGQVFRDDHAGVPGRDVVQAVGDAVVAV